MRNGKKLFNNDETIDEKLPDGNVIELNKETEKDSTEERIPDMKTPDSWEMQDSDSDSDSYNYKMFARVHCCEERTSLKTSEQNAC